MSTQALATQNGNIDIAVVEKVITGGDLGQLTPEQRVRYYIETCDSLKLNWKTKPFDVVALRGSGAKTLYPNKGCAEQLAGIHNISVDLLEATVEEGVRIQKAKACLPNGRCVTKTGAVTVAGKRGDDYANAVMKCECVPLDSEILTRDGFKRYDEVSVGEEVLAYDVETDSCSWTPLRHVTVHDSLPMALMSTPGGRFSVTCTPDHSWAVKTGDVYRPDPRGDGSRGPRGPYKSRGPAHALVKANEILTHHRVVIAAPLAPEAKESILSPAEAAILGWAVTDGTIKRSGNSVRIGICQSKEENFAPIRELVTVAAGEVKEFVSPARTRTFPTGKTYDTREQHWWYLPAAISKAILERAGFHDKSDLPSIVTRLDAPARKAMLQAFMMAEADQRGNFYNGNEGLLEAFQILCTLEGYAVARVKQGAVIKSIRRRKQRHVAGVNLTLTPIEDAPAWCPTTDYGTWVMRQAGHVVVTGNTKAHRRAVLALVGLNMPDESELETIHGSQRFTMDVESGEFNSAPQATVTPLRPAPVVAEVVDQGTGEITEPVPSEQQALALAATLKALRLQLGWDQARLKSEAKLRNVSLQSVAGLTSMVAHLEREIAEKRAQDGEEDYEAIEEAGAEQGTLLDADVRPVDRWGD